LTALPRASACASADAGTHAGDNPPARKPRRAASRFRALRRAATSVFKCRRQAASWLHGSSASRLEAWLAAAISAILALLMLTTAVARHGISEMGEATRRVAQTDAALAELAVTLSAVRDAESASHGFVITGDPARLETYLWALAEANAQFARLRQRIADPAGQKVRLDQAQALLLARLASLTELVETRSHAGFAAARRLLMTHDGHLQTAALQRVFRAMRDVESRLQQAHLATADSSRTQAAIATLAALPLIASLAGLLLYWVRRHLIDRRTTETALQMLADHDELTGLANRRVVNSRLKEESLRAWRYGHPLALIMLDVDHFKAINDTYGHLVGDAALAWIAEHLRTSVRSTDLPARFGGEEFAVVLPETTLQEAFGLAERIRQAVAAHPYRSTEPAAEITLTLSAGVAELTGGDRRLEPDVALIAAADNALYHAKHQGRNRTVSLSPALDAQLPLSLTT
jgi:diguanylate cyclase (GGDEF)-like protein